MPLGVEQELSNEMETSTLMNVYLKLMFVYVVLNDDFYLLLIDQHDIFRIYLDCDCQ